MTSANRTSGTLTISWRHTPKRWCGSRFWTGSSPIVNSGSPTQAGRPGGAPLNATHQACSPEGVTCVSRGRQLADKESLRTPSPFRGGTHPRRLQPERCLPQLLRRNLVLEVVRIERVHAAFGCLRLRIHEVHHRLSAGAWQRHIMRVVVGHPVHLPEAKELLVRLGH